MVLCVVMFNVFAVFVRAVDVVGIFASSCIAERAVVVVVVVVYVAIVFVVVFC